MFANRRTILNMSLKKKMNKNLLKSILKIDLDLLIDLITWWIRETFIMVFSVRKFQLFKIHYNIHI